jgi:hypothetical protein
MTALLLALLILGATARAAQSNQATLVQFAGGHVVFGVQQRPDVDEISTTAISRFLALEKQREQITHPRPDTLRHAAIGHEPTRSRAYLDPTTAK